MKKEYLTKFLLRMGLAFVFLYAGIAAFFNPDNWIGFIPSWIEFIISRENFLYIHSSIDILLGLWFIYNKKTFYAALISCVFLFFIIIFNLNSFEIIFRDVAILLMAVALAVSYWK